MLEVPPPQIDAAYYVKGTASWHSCTLKAKETPLSGAGILDEREAVSLKGNKKAEKKSIAENMQVS